MHGDLGESRDGAGTSVEPDSEMAMDARPKHGGWRLLVSPDHRTPLRTRAHSYGAVPFAVAGTGVASHGQRSYDEAVATESGLAFEKGHELMPWFLLQGDQGL